MGTANDNDTLKPAIHRRLLDLSSTLLQSMHKTQEVIKGDLSRLNQADFNPETRISSVSREQQLIRQFNEQTRYGTLFVWVVLIVCTVVFFFIIMFIRALS